MLAGSVPDDRTAPLGRHILDLAVFWPSTLLCTDLHAGNVLAAGRESWLATDPKPYLGDPTYDARRIAPALTLNRSWKHPPSLLATDRGERPTVTDKAGKGTGHQWREHWRLPTGRNEHSTIDPRHWSELVCGDPTAKMKLPPRRPSRGDEGGRWRLGALSGDLPLENQISPYESKHRVVEESMEDRRRCAKW